MNTLILYYSYGGNTKRIAEMIQREIGGDIARMDTVVPYDGDYDEVVNQGQREIAEGYCPELKPLHIGWRDYDTIILGLLSGGTPLRPPCAVSWSRLT